MINKDALEKELVITQDSLKFWTAMPILGIGDAIFIQNLEYKIKILELLLLTEEKRRLLTCIIEWMVKCALRSKNGPYDLLGVYMDKFFSLVEIHKRVNSATTMDELAAVGKELAKFEQEYLELLL